MDILLSLPLVSFPQNCSSYCSQHHLPTCQLDHVIFWEKLFNGFLLLLGNNWDSETRIPRPFMVWPLPVFTAALSLLPFLCMYDGFHFTYVPVNTFLPSLCLTDFYSSFMAQRGLSWALDKFRFLCYMFSKLLSQSYHLLHFIEAHFQVYHFQSTSGLPCAYGPNELLRPNKALSIRCLQWEASTEAMDTEGLCVRHW